MMNIPEWAERQSVWFTGKESIGDWTEIKPGTVWAETAESVVETLGAFHPQARFKIINHSDFENRHTPWDDEMVCQECETRCESDWKCLCCLTSVDTEN